jgi:hypothetical protein
MSEKLFSELAGQESKEKEEPSVSSCLSDPELSAVRLCWRFQSAFSLSGKRLRVHHKIGGRMDFSRSLESVCHHAG